MSASIAAISWCWAIGLPIVSRALRVLERIVGRALREPEALRADPGPRAVEDPHRDLEALALLAEQVLRRDAAVVEEELAGGRALDPHLRLDPADLEAGRVRLDEEGGDALVAGVGSVFAKTV